jgi:hypothetical protein
MTEPSTARAFFQRQLRTKMMLQKSKLQLRQEPQRGQQQQLLR